MPGSGHMPATTSTSADSAARLQRATTRSMSVWSSADASRSSASLRGMGGGGLRFAPSLMSDAARSSPRAAMGFAKATRTPRRSRARTRPRHAVVSPTWRPAGATRRTWGMFDLAATAGWGGPACSGCRGLLGDADRDLAILRVHLDHDALRLGAAEDDLGGVHRDHELLVGGHDERLRPHGSRDPAAGGLAVRGVQAGVEDEADEGEQVDDLFANEGGVLADAPRTRARPGVPARPS